MIAQKIKTPAQLASLIRGCKARSQKVVFTNGCFDILHWGHVSYLERARKLGAVLVVAVNSDRSVRKLKGPTRPIHALSDRMRVIAALESVSFVTSFSSETPLALILMLKPDVLVKGGDWKPESMVGAKEVQAWGGRVRSLPLISGRSTTSALSRLQRHAHS